MEPRVDNSNTEGDSAEIPLSSPTKARINFTLILSSLKIIWI